MPVLRVIALAGGALHAQNPVDYTRQVKPVLEERCIACHGVLQQNGGLRLDTAAFARQGENRWSRRRSGRGCGEVAVEGAGGFALETETAPGLRVTRSSSLLPPRTVTWRNV